MVIKETPPHHPGSILKQHYLEPSGLSVKDLANALKSSSETVAQILNERGPVTTDIALRLSRLFSTSAELWLDLQTRYNIWDTAQKMTDWLAIEPLNPTQDKQDDQAQDPSLTNQELITTQIIQGINITEAQTRLTGNSVMVKYQFLLDTKTMKILYANSTALEHRVLEEIMKDSSDKILKNGKSMQKPLKELIQQRAADFLSSEMGRKNLYTDQFEWVAENGSPIKLEFLTRYYLNQKTGNVEVMGFVREITECKIIEKGNEMQHDLFLDIFNMAPCPMALFDPSIGKMLIANNESLKITGYTYEEVVGNLIDYVFTDSEEYRELLELAQLIGHIDWQPLVVRRKDGQKLYLLFSTETIHFNGMPYMLGMAVDMTKHMQDEAELEKYRENLETLVMDRTNALEAKTKHLQEMNTALDVLLQKREMDKKSIEESIVKNMRALIYPYIEKMRESRLDDNQQLLLTIIEKHLDEIESPMLKDLQLFGLTNRELQVASLVKDGKTSKEIAEILAIGKHSIDAHRKNIRKKLRIDQNINLEVRLQSLI